MKKKERMELVDKLAHNFTPIREIPDAIETWCRENGSHDKICESTVRRYLRKMGYKYHRKGTDQHPYPHWVDGDGFIVLHFRHKNPPLTLPVM